MSLQACADIVAKGDPDRFRAAMAAPVAARAVLFPLYAFNVEVARAPWVASEPMIGEMRLQWWRDVLEEIAGGGPVRAHDVSTALAAVLDAEAAEALDALVAVRRWDLYRDPFEDAAHFERYIGAGTLLMETGLRLLGGRFGARSRAWGRGASLARFLCAVLALEARGRVPMIDGRKEAVQALASEALVQYPSFSGLRHEVAKPARAALFEGAGARALLRRIVRDPGGVASGTLGQSALSKSLSMFATSLRLR